jgi:hypothetical protein
MPGIYDVTFDLCKASDVINNPFMANVLPNAKEMIGKYLGDCPYKVCMEICRRLSLKLPFFFVQGEQFIEIKVNAANIPPLGPPGYNRLDVIFLANRTKFIYKLSVTGITRNQKWF